MIRLDRVGKTLGRCMALADAQSMEPKDLVASDLIYRDRVGETYAIAYNPAVVPNPPKTYEELAKWVAENPGQFGYNGIKGGMSGVGFVMGSVTSYARAKAESLGLDAKGGIAERSDRLVSILVMTGLGALLDLPILMYVTLWALALGTTYTVVFRVLKVRRQAIALDAANAASSDETGD